MLSIRCSLHPRYQAKRPPKNDCEACRLLFSLVSSESTEAVLNKLGSGLIGKPGDDRWYQALECLEVDRKSTLSVRCCHHTYRATRRPGWKCSACWLLFVLKFQNHPDGERRLGAFNPYTYVIGDVDLRKACAELMVTRS